MNLRQALSGKLKPEEMQHLKTSFDIIGHVAIIEIDPPLRKRQKLIAETLMRIHKNVKTVCRKGSERKGDLRLRDIKYVAGSRKTETTHVESGCRYMLDVRKTYFSPRESTERDRIAGLVKNGETVMVMFGGIAPFAILIARRKDISAYSVELNRDACRYAEKNVALNRVSGKVRSICGDVRQKCSPYYGSCDRVIMPLPRQGHAFLDVAIRCLKPEGGTIHFYYAGPEAEAKRYIKDAGQKLKRKIRVRRVVQVLPFAPRTWKLCLDVDVK